MPVQFLPLEVAVVLLFSSLKRRLKQSSGAKLEYKGNLTMKTAKSREHWHKYTTTVECWCMGRMFHKTLGGHVWVCLISLSELRRLSSDPWPVAQCEVRAKGHRSSESLEQSVMHSHNGFTAVFLVPLIPIKPGKPFIHVFIYKRFFWFIVYWSFCEENVGEYL